MVGHASARRGAAEIEPEQSEREHQLFMCAHSKGQNPPRSHKANVAKSADPGDLRRGDLWDLQEVKQPEVMSERGH